MEAMNLILNSVTKDYLNHTVLSGVSLTIREGERVGLIGENGSGKTTLLKIIAGLEKPDGGNMQKEPQSMTIGYVPQAPDASSSETVCEFLQRSAGLEGNEEYKIPIALSEVESDLLIDKRFGELSSGQKTRVYLARLLLNQPDILLLDEPTNHLDITALNWLEHYLANYDGSVLVVSHDRRFLDNLVAKIAELDNGEIKIYGGNYSFYREQKEIEKESEKRQYEIQQQIIKRLEDEARKKKEQIQKLEKSDKPTRDHDKFAATFFANRASRKFAKVAQVLESRLEKIERLDKPEADIELSTIFKPKNESSQTALFVKDVSKSFGDQPILKDFKLLINRGEKVVLTGPNGSGKTTLINLILGRLKPDKGTIELGNGVEIGYLPQESGEISVSKSLLQYLVEDIGLDQTNAHKLAKKFLFSDDNLRTSVNDLSSGQKSRLALAKIMASGANFIILDEPTNHLDISARESLEKAVISYPGTLLVVSHDRYFLDMINFDKTINL